MKSSFVQQNFPIRLAQCTKYSLVTALLLICVVGTGKIYAQEVPVATWYCGIRLTVAGTYNMTNDITCPYGGIGIEIVAVNVTLNLQGHLISGPFQNISGIGIKADFGNQIVKGPGKIQGFQNGIWLKGLDTVSHVQIEQFYTVGITGGPVNKIRYNTVRGTVPAGYYRDGMSFNGARNEITGNMITGTEDVALRIKGDYAVVRGNALVGNGYGVYFDCCYSMMTVTGNDMSSNSIGALIYGSLGTISDNHFNANGEAGLYVGGNSFMIQGNTADRNHFYGIALLQGTSANTVKFNTAIGNGEFDLWWGGVGTGNIWTDNNCDTWSLNMGDNACVFP